MQKKNANIAALWKQLKLPPPEHPQTKEILQEEKQKDEMMSLILQMTTHIKEMEIEMDKLVQEKEATKTESAPPIVIPMVTNAVPSTLAEELAPKFPLATVVLMTSSTTSATKSSNSAVQQIDEANKLIKSME